MLCHCQSQLFRHHSTCKSSKCSFSSEHNFVGHYGQPPGTSPLIERERIKCVAGKGLLGIATLIIAKITRARSHFFAAEVFERSAPLWNQRETGGGVAPQTVIVSGVDLLSLIGV
jgi:hypothetical protein